MNFDNYRDLFRPISSIHSCNTRGATCGDFSLSEKHHNMEYVPFAIMV